ncbi:hypothetical protein AB0C07_08205 [Actinoplanes missouriensis]|uniref:hypothetical protein n=1 Tax=Actinoplanes missouriensis TaxID=1866 RepID=UPI0033C6729B
MNAVLAVTIAALLTLVTSPADAARPAPGGSTMTLNGPSVELRLDRPGRRGAVTFGVGLVVTAPDGTAVVQSWIPESISDNTHGSVGFVAPLTGAYTFTLNPYAMDTGTATILAESAPPTR